MPLLSGRTMHTVPHSMEPQISCLGINPYLRKNQGTFKSSNIQLTAATINELHRMLNHLGINQFGAYFLAIRVR